MPHVILDSDKRVLHIVRKARPLTPAETAAGHAIHDWPEDTLAEIRVGHHVRVESDAIAGYDDAKIKAARPTLIERRRAEIKAILARRLIEYAPFGMILLARIDANGYSHYRSTMGRVMKCWAAAKHDANLSEVEQSFNLAAGAYGVGASHRDFEWTPRSTQPQITQTALLPASGDRYFGGIRLNDNGRIWLGIVAAQNTAPYSSGQDLSASFEANGEVDITVGSDTLTVALAGRDPTEPYIWTPANAAEVTAFIGRRTEAADSIASTVTLRVPSVAWPKIRAFADVNLAQFHQALDRSQWSTERRFDREANGKFNDSNNNWYNDAPNGGASAADSEVTVPATWNASNLLEIFE